MNSTKAILAVLTVLLAGCNWSTVANPSTEQPADVLPTQLVIGPPAPSASDLSPSVVVTPQATPAPTATLTLSPTPEPTPTPAPTPQIVKVKGTQTHGNSKKFSLSGDYTVTITGKAKSNKISGFELGGGNLIIQLIGDLTFDPLVNEIVKGGRTYTFSTFEYDLDPGTYYMTLLIPAGSWTVTFVPIVQ